MTFTDKLRASVIIFFYVTTFDDVNSVKDINLQNSFTYQACVILKVYKKLLYYTKRQCFILLFACCPYDYEVITK